MELRLNVFFGGMCAFVPEEDGRRAWVFLPNYAHGSMRVDVAPRHQAVLLCNLADVDGMDPLTTGRVLFDLEGTHLSFLPAGQAVSGRELTIAGFDEIGSDPRLGHTERDSLAWVAPLEKASQRVGLPAGAGRVAGDLADDRLADTRAQLLAARLLLDRGHLSVQSLSRYGGSLVVWKLRPVNQDGPGHRQILASRVVWTQTVQAPWIEISMPSLTGEGDQRSLRLRPANGSSINIEVLNEEAEAILGLAGPAEVHVGQPRNQDRVFESFFELSSVRSLREQRPIPVADELIDDSLAGVAATKNSPPCSPVVMGAGFAASVHSPPCSPVLMGIDRS